MATKTPIVSMSSRGARRFPFRGRAQSAELQSSHSWPGVKCPKPLVIDNRPGGGGNVALQAVARAPADGYTL